MFDKIPNPGLYTDFNGLAALRHQAQADQPEALEKVAQQFEAIFVQMMLKSMRDALPAEGMMETDGTRLYRDMYDKQLSLHLATQSGLGLSEMIVRQLGGEERKIEQSEGAKLLQYRSAPIPHPQAVPSTADKPVAVEPSPLAVKPADERPINSPEAFVDQLWPFAREAGEVLGVDPKLLLAQAALESGWGKRMIQRANGENSYNLFGIKADRRWQGDRTSVDTLEYQQDIPHRQRAHFRTYADFGESFRDYVSFIKGNSRYGLALEAAADPERYIQALQAAGYATDPDYAAKVMQIYRQPELSEYSGEASHAAQFGEIGDRG